MTANHLESVADSNSSERAGRPIICIERVSFSYDGLEDRIALDVTDASQTVVRLWLTRFGADALVRATAQRVEAYAAAQIAGTQVSADQAIHARDAALAARQLTARLTQRRAAAVRLPPGTPEYLVRGLAMPQNSRCIQLELRCRPELDVNAFLQPAELFQWLGAMRRQYKRASWDLSAWPAWFGTAS